MNEIEQKDNFYNLLFKASNEELGISSEKDIIEVKKVDIPNIIQENYKLFDLMKYELDGNAYKDIVTIIATDKKHKLILYSDARAKKNRFSVADVAGNPLWHGSFTDGDNKNGAREQNISELCAAGKAVFLANKIKEAAKLDTLHLKLNMNAKWLIYISKPTQKGHYLTYLAQRYGITIEVHWIPGVKNPADKWTIAKTFKNWQDNDLKSLIINP